MLNRRFKEYFNFTQKERNGIIVLLVIVVLLSIINIYVNTRSSGYIVLTNEEFQKDVDEFENSLQQKETKETYAYFNETKKRDNINPEWFTPDVIFNFDPNTVTKSELKELGFSQKQITTLINFRKKGGVFNVKEDLIKIYGISEIQYNSLEPYIQIEPKKVDSELDEVKYVKEEVLIEINSASIDELTKLKGVGNSFADKIIKYRDLLGGYYTSDQLLEVYGMDSTRFLGFKDHILVDTSKINRIDLNSADFKTLIRHPYLNKYETEAILKYKKLIGNFKMLEEVVDNNVLERDVYDRVKPYLKIETK